MSKIDPRLLDQMAELEVSALLEGLNDPECRTNPAFLEKVRKFLQQNKLMTQPETPGIKEVQKNSEVLPVFEN